MKIYLAGKMSGLSFEEMNKWRQDIKNRLSVNYPDINAINPVEFYSFEVYDKMKCIPKEVKEYDLWLVKNSDLILVNLDYPDSIGTAIELHMAQEWKIPVVGFGKTKNHDWIECCLTRKCKNMEEAIDYIISFYYVNLK
jgi:nucleoside 2-deoxyribosyltransferase